MIKRLLRECKQILVLEEGYPIVEEMLKGYPGLEILWAVWTEPFPATEN